MPKIKFINASGIVIEADARDGESLMTAAINAKIDAIAAECGGACACGTCHCYIDEAWQAHLLPVSDHEEAMLECVIAPKPQSRLSCQIRLTEALDGLTVHLPASQH